MALFILDDAAGIGSDDLDPFAAFIDMVIIANDDGIGLDDPTGGLQRVTYVPSTAGVPQTRLGALVNTAFSPDYGSGAQNVDTVVIAGLSGFTLDDGTSFANNGTALAPMGSGLAGAGQNTTANCLVIYDTQATICVAREGTGGTLDLPITSPVILYHEFSHAFRIVNDTLLALSGTCDPSSPEENAAITDENDLRTQIAQRQGLAPILRDPGIHCGTVGTNCGSADPSSCCIIATVASGSLSSPEVESLRAVRDHFVRSTEVGYAFFQRFFQDYYSFSPQVCTYMAGDGRLPPQFLEGFVRPLLTFWKIMIERSDNDWNDTQLGDAIMRHYPGNESADAWLAAIRRTATHWMGGAGSEEAPSGLIRLLRERAWPSAHMQWALIRPVRIYHDVLALQWAGADGARVGRAFRMALEDWAPDVPISDVWAALPRGRVRRELAWCDKALLQTPASKARFRDRLRARFADLPAVIAGLGGPGRVQAGAS